MRFKNLFMTALAVLALASCAKEEPLSEVEDLDTLRPFTARAAFGIDDEVWYDGVIDHEKGTVDFTVPYYLSDTEEIQGDLTRMIIKAKFPSLAVVEPKVTNVEVDLLNGTTARMTLRDNHYKDYTFKATYFKAEGKELFSATNSAGSKFTIVPPADGKPGEVIYLRVKSNYEADLKAVTLHLSPWATIEGSCYNPDTKTCDFTKGTEFKVVAQNGDSVDYKFVLKTTELVGPGEIGSVYNMFGYQLVENDPRGFTPVNNRQMAIIDNYLIISNSSTQGFQNMVVLDRFSGDKVDKKINVEGIPEDRQIHAICNDDANHLVACSFVFNHDKWGTKYNDFSVYVWKDGLDKKPVNIFSDDIVTGDKFAAVRAQNANLNVYEVGRYICVRGDMTKGNAVFATFSKTKLRACFLKIENGQAKGDMVPVWDATESVVQSMGNCTKVIPLDKDDMSNFIWHSGNPYQGINYFPAGTGTRGFGFTMPKSHWWAGNRAGGKGGLYGMGYTEFNGMYLLALANTDGAAARLWVSNIGKNPDADSLEKGYLFDTRDSDIPGAGPVVTGMTSPWAFNSADTVLGTNGNGTGDIVFGKTADGSAVQVYMLTTDNGLIAYEISKYKL